MPSQAWRSQSTPVACELDADLKTIQTSFRRSSWQFHPGHAFQTIWVFCAWRQLKETRDVKHYPKPVGQHSGAALLAISKRDLLSRQSASTRSGGRGWLESGGPDQPISVVGWSDQLTRLVNWSPDAVRWFSCSLHWGVAEGNAAVEAAGWAGAVRPATRGSGARNLGKVTPVRQRVEIGRAAHAVQETSVWRRSETWDTRSRSIRPPGMPLLP